MARSLQQETEDMATPPTIEEIVTLQLSGEDGILYKQLVAQVKREYRRLYRDSLPSNKVRIILEAMKINGKVEYLGGETLTDDRLIKLKPEFEDYKGAEVTNSD